MYYLLIIISVIIFGGCFALKDKYREKRGSKPDVTCCTDPYYKPTETQMKLYRELIMGIKE